MAKSKKKKKESENDSEDNLKEEKASFLESKISNLLFFVLGMLLVTIFLLSFGVGFNNNYDDLYEVFRDVVKESELKSGRNDTITQNIISEQEASEKVSTFLTELTGSEVNSLDVEDAGSLYQVTVNFQGQQIPVYITKDGERFIEQAISIDQGVPQQPEPETADLDSSQIENEPYLGDEDAPVIIVEFSDYNCPFCGRHNDQTKPLIQENYIDEGLVRYVFMDFVGVGTPIPHEATQCVRELGNDDLYWEMSKAILDNQNQDVNSVDYLTTLATDIGIDQEDFVECMESNRYEEQIMASTSFGQSLGITGAPGFLIGNDEVGYTVVSGAQPYNVFENQIENLLN